MMMMGRGKKIATIIIGGMGKEKESSHKGYSHSSDYVPKAPMEYHSEDKVHESEEPMGSDDALYAASKSLMNAVSEGSSEGVARALTESYKILSGKTAHEVD